MTVVGETASVHCGEVRDALLAAHAVLSDAISYLDGAANTCWDVVGEAADAGVVRVRIRAVQGVAEIVRKLETEDTALTSTDV